MSDEIMVQQQEQGMAAIEQAAMAVVNDTPPLAPANFWTNPDALREQAKIAQWFSKSKIIPQNYQDNPADCLIALDFAARINTSPLFVMQNLYTVKGRPSWSGQACKAIIESCGRYKDVDVVRFGKEGTDERGCYITATRISDGKKIDGAKVTISMAKAEGWTSNSKWRNMPEIMLMYRASAFFAKENCPNELMGTYTPGEVEDAESRQRTQHTATELTAALKEEK